MWQSLNNDTFARMMQANANRMSRIQRVVNNPILIQFYRVSSSATLKFN